MGLISGNNELMRKVLDYVKSLTRQLKQTDIKGEAKSDGLIHIDPTIPLPSDKFVGMVSSSREDDEKALEEYLAEKYNL